MAVRVSTGVVVSGCMSVQAHRDAAGWYEKGDVLHESLRRRDRVSVYVSVCSYSVYCVSECVLEREARQDRLMPVFPLILELPPLPPRAVVPGAPPTKHL